MLAAWWGGGLVVVPLWLAASFAVAWRLSHLGDDR